MVPTARISSSFFGQLIQICRWRLVWQIAVLSVPSLALMGCSAFELAGPTNLPKLTPLSYVVEGTTWVGPYNDANGRGLGTLTISFDRLPEARNNKLHGTWSATFPGGRQDISGPAHRNYNWGDPDSISLQLDVPDRGAGGMGCWMFFDGTVNGRQMSGTILTGFNICTAQETKRQFAATLALQ